MRPGPVPNTWLVYVTEEQMDVLVDSVILDPDPTWRERINQMPGAQLVRVDDVTKSSPYTGGWLS